MPYGIAALGADTRERYGPMTVERHFRLRARGLDLLVLHHGQDVTHRCRFADDTGDGRAELFKHRDGRPYWEDVATGQIAREHVTGVRMVPRGAAV